VNSKRATAIGRLLLIVLLVVFPAVGMFVLPAALLWVLGGFRTLDRFTRAVYCLFFGISCWTWLPWLTRYIPISLSSLIWATVLALAAVLAFLAAVGRGRPEPPAKRLGKRTCILLGIVSAVIVLARMAPSAFPYVPPGDDMSMHAYYARLIIDSNSIPETHRPLLPIDSFGEYPIGFAVLIACTSLTSWLEVQTTAMLWTSLTYVLLTSGLFLLLRVWFSPAVSLVTAALATFLAASPQIYSEGGGNPTVLSFALILAALGLFFSLRRHHSFLDLFTQASLWASGFLTHSIPFLGVTYSLIALGLGFCAYAMASKMLDDLRTYAVRCACVLVIALLLVAPFMMRLSPHISDSEIEWCRSWHRHSGHSWHGNVGNCLWTIPEYICFTFKTPFVCIVLPGLLISTFSWRRRLSVILSSLAVIVLVINSQYWLLPFSCALYPERMAMLLLAPMAVICAGLIGKLWEFVAWSTLTLKQCSNASLGDRIAILFTPISALVVFVVVLLRVVSVLFSSLSAGSLRFRHVAPAILILLLFQVSFLRRRRTIAVAAVGLSVIGMTACVALSFCWGSYHLFYVQNMSSGGRVSMDDLEAFEWIKRNTRASDVILNMIGGPALWIPAICGRRIISPHSNPLYFDELREGNQDVVPSYFFVGGEAFPSAEAVDHWLARARGSPYWREEAVFGRTAIFRLQPHRGRMNWSEVIEAYIGPSPTD